MVTEGERQIANAIWASDVIHASVREYDSVLCLRHNESPHESHLQTVRSIAIRSADSLPAELRVLMALKGWI